MHMMDPEVISKVVEIEDSVKGFSGSMDIEYLGLGKCIASDYTAVIFCDSSFQRPDDITIEMVNEEGLLIGHDVPECLYAKFKKKENLIWVSESFILYSDRLQSSKPHLVMKAARFPGKNDFKDTEPWIFYPSVNAANYLSSHYGIARSKGLISAIIGFGNIGRSVPVSDMVKITGSGSSHREPAPQDTFD